ncbi:ABC transporter permease [Pengzhenrongella frigida]|uniref:ABC transporter permease n=2 Tax=Pengzhenrongella frigida TaxID=1259133 RepID=A0A4Q5MW52_9MICO|nr:ABC transporter permease [Cellulomonas sp. HLT2-17]
MTASDLRQRVRDRSVIIFALVVPLALMFVFNLTLGGAADQSLDPVTVAVSAPADDTLAPILIASLTQVDGVDVTVDEVSADEARDRARSGTAELGVVIPEGFGDAVRQGEETVVAVTEGDGSGLESDILLTVMQGVLAQLSAGAVTAAAGAQSGVPAEDLGALAQQAATQAAGLNLTEGEAANEQLSIAGALVAGQAGLFLLFTVGFGVLGLIAEREQGTLARLRSMPMRPGLIVTAKGLVSFILGFVATGVLLTAGSIFFGVSFGSPVAVAVLIVCAVAAATSLMFIIARAARTAEQASALQTILALVLAISGGAFFPLTATGALDTVLGLNPIAAFTRGLGITSGGGGLGDIGVPVAIMLTFAVVGLAASRLVPDRGRDL